MRTPDENKAGIREIGELRMTNFEAMRESLYYTKVDPNNAEQIALASNQERKGFGTGIDPQELPEVLQYIAEHGHVWLQFVEENGKEKATGVIELIPLRKALEFKLEEIKTEFDIHKSPLTMITRNHGKNFEAPRKFADDDDIIYHHGIAMSRRGKGYGTLLLNYALKETPNAMDRFIACFIDAAKMNGNKNILEPAANESSYTLHMKAGFVLIGVVEPPVYENTITHYSLMRFSDSKPLKYRDTHNRVKFDNPDVNKTINNVKELVSGGFVGISYDKKLHEMTFAKLRQFPTKA